MIEKIDKIIINPSILSKNFDRSLFENITYASSFPDHQTVTTQLKDKNPYTITVILESLKNEYRNKKEYVEKTKIPTISRYREILYDLFNKEYGEQESGNVYREWLDKYRPRHERERKYEWVDEYIVKQELEPRYRQKILERFKNHEQLFKDRFRIDRNRYYNLPEPLNCIDWRTPYDNIFVWEEDGRKLARRGGSGSSGGRETNSIFIFGLLALNKIQPVPSFLFLYSKENKLLFIKKFDRLCIPRYDLGENYHLDHSEEEKLKQGGSFLTWDGLDEVKEIEILA
jgi:hypothetical protein